MSGVLGHDAPAWFDGKLVAQSDRSCNEFNKYNQTLQTERTSGQLVLTRGLHRGVIFGSTLKVVTGGPGRSWRAIGSLDHQLW